MSEQIEYETVREAQAALEGFEKGFRLAREQIAQEVYDFDINAWVTENVGPHDENADGITTFCDGCTTAMTITSVLMDVAAAIARGKTG